MALPARAPSPELESDLDKLLESELKEFDMSESHQVAAEACLAACCQLIKYDIAELWTFVGALDSTEGRSKTPLCLHMYSTPLTIESYQTHVGGMLSLANRAERHTLSPLLVEKAIMEGKTQWYTSESKDSPLHESLPLNTAVAMPLSFDLLHKDVVAIFFATEDILRTGYKYQLSLSMAKGAALSLARALPVSNKAVVDSAGDFNLSSSRSSSRMRMRRTMSRLSEGPDEWDEDASPGGAGSDSPLGSVGSACSSEIMEVKLPEQVFVGGGGGGGGASPNEARLSGGIAQHSDWEGSGSGSGSERGGRGAKGGKKSPGVGPSSPPLFSPSHSLDSGGGSAGADVPPKGPNLPGDTTQRPPLPPSAGSFTATKVRTDVAWEELSTVEFLVNGSRCTIYTAVFMGRAVTVKLLNKGVADKDLVRAELELEARMLMRLDHPHIVTLIGTGTIPERFILLERLDGGTLAQRFGNALAVRDRRQRFVAVRPLTYMQILLGGLQMAEAFKYMHEEALPGRCILHRDLKPDNVAFDSDGNLKLIDLGLAKVIPQGTNADEVFAMTGQTGSLRYMAPEVANGLRYNRKADVHSFAMVLWEMAASKKPFLEYDRKLIMTMAFSEKAMRPACKKEWPPAFSALLKRCWAADPKDRPTFSAIEGSLRTMVREATAAEEPQGRPMSVAKNPALKKMFGFVLQK